jgi:hypothetical protein
MATIKMSSNITAEQTICPLGHESLSALRAIHYDPGELNLSKLGKGRRYTRSRLYTLMHEYIKIRNDLLVAASFISDAAESQRYVNCCRDYLVKAKASLESENPRIYFSSSMLDLAARSLVWLYTEDTVQFRYRAVMAQLEDLQDADDAKRAFRQLEDVRDGDIRRQRAALADALEYFSRQERRLLLEDSLQVSRLHRLLWYMGTAFVLLVIAAPAVTINLSQSVPGWPVLRIGPAWLTQLIAAAAVGFVGAAGGLFSGLINTRDSSTTLGEYRTSMLKLALKPLVGAVASITLYIFLDWQITGMKVINGGTFLLVGFLAGFSERYFLKLLQAPTEHNDLQNAQRQDRLASVRDQLVGTIAGSPLPPSNSNGKATTANSDLISESQAGRSVRLTRWSRLPRRTDSAPTA